MNNSIKSTLAIGLAVVAAVLTSTAQAEIHSKSSDLVVMEARDLPEQAQTPGNSLFLHSDNARHTYLYVEQQQGARLSVFDDTGTTFLLGRDGLTVVRRLSVENDYKEAQRGTQGN